MKKMIACILSVLMLTAALTACGRKVPAQEAADGTHYTVGICNYVDDASLNQIVENLRAQLEKLGEERGVQFDILYDNCNADTNLMSQIISNFQADGADLLVAVATPVAMSMQAATEGTDTPVVFAAVSDPVSVGLVDSLEAPGSNVTGTSDYLDTASVMNLIFAQNPDAKKIGLLYDVGQDSATSAIEAAKQYLTEKGVEYIERTGTTVDEIALAAQALVTDGVDAVFTPTDNTVMKSELSIYETFADAGIPHYTGADSFALNGAFLGYGVDYAAKDEADIAKLIHTKQELGLKGGMLIGNPIPEEYAMDFDYMEEVIQKALVKADEAGVHGKNITPFLLASIKDITGGKAFEANVKLALNNARCAAKIAKALSDME